ncbi:MAG: hypothetical protein HN507_02000 [Flavobacteriaceae bacterium]|jgi:hypothetical protein|nr:hypothetical protein [Flavobacteriaceae bacterium]
MKNIYKSILVAIVIIGGFSSCSESNLSIDTLYDEVNTSGSILRILTPPADIIGLPGTPFPTVLDFLVEVQQGDGSFPPEFKEVRVKIQLFADQDANVPIENAPQILYQTILSSEFEELLGSVNGLPMYQIDIPTEDIIASYPGVQFPGLTFLITNFELEMTELDAEGNPIVWDVTNAGATLSGPYMSSPFSWKTIFKL